MYVHYHSHCIISLGYDYLTNMIMTKRRLFYIMGLLVIGCVTVNAQTTAEQQDQMYQYLKGIIDNMNDPILDKKHAPIGKKGDTWRNDGDCKV